MWTLDTPARVIHLLLVLSPLSVLGSSGDREPLYKGCVDHCSLTGCAPFLTHNHACHPASACSEHIPWELRLTRWTCEDDCKYQCMLEMERFQRSQGYGTQKYYGKWPFQRIYGMQEAASAILSLFNLITHISCIAYLWRVYRSTTRTYPYMWLWTMYSICNVWAWATSAVFHTRDTKLTERLDYTAAIGAIYMGAAAAIIRVFNLRTGSGAIKAISAVTAGLAWHLHHMLYIKFDYGWNVKVCVAVGVSSALLWLLWLIITPHPGRITLLVFLLAAHAALALELLDFPPKYLLPYKDKQLTIVETLINMKPDELLSGLGLLDAHALWHAATVPLTIGFYWFFTLDVRNHNLKVLKPGLKQE